MHILKEPLSHMKGVSGSMGKSDPGNNGSHNHIFRGFTLDLAMLT